MTRDTFTMRDVYGMLATTGIDLPSQPLQDHDELGQGVKAFLLRRYGANVWVILQPPPGSNLNEGWDGTLSLRVILGFLPKAGVAALFSPPKPKLTDITSLSKNMVTSRARLALNESDYSVCLVQGIRLPLNRKELDPSWEDFPPMLDAIVAAYHHHGTELIREFGLLQQPSSTAAEPT